jgi:hypothetical protein
MTALTGANRGIHYGWDARESGWNSGMDANLKLVDALLHLAMKSRVLATPAATPAEGERCIVGAGPTGAWTGKTGQIAVRSEGTWAFCAPRVGWLAFAEDEAVLTAYKATGWSAGLAL